ncbi:MAG: 16S rRNA (guanine(966)-N(2))-methyltransferase RsmD [Candidatus Omnitrophica bacterium]|nr:16S rRNA (guanine(966)-N(2))-methyltransferase RsmD [Candidatus Omnitrophota bacterium]
MRISSGIYKGRQIKVPPGIRPTAERVRSAIFDILGNRVGDAALLELCAGSGAVGFEALSRGAKRVVFVDKSRQCARVITLNARTLDVSLGDRVSVVCADAAQAIQRLGSQGARFDLLFIDPPYVTDVYKKCLPYIGDCAILNPNALVIVEHPHKHPLTQLANFQLIRTQRYGDTAVSFLSI